MNASLLTLRRVSAAASLALAFTFCTVDVRCQVVEVPYLTGRVTDNAEILSTDSRQRIADMIQAYEQSTTNQIAVLTMPSLENGSIEEFAARVIESWKLGVKGKDNGILVLVSPGDRRARIEVGKGLRSALSEAAAGRIIRDFMVPRFDEGDFDKGLEEGVDAIVGQLGTGGPAEPVSKEGGQAGKDSFFEGAAMSVQERILFGCFIFGIIGLFTVIGVMTPGVGWFLYLFLIPFWAMFPIVVVGVRGALTLLVIYLAGFPAAKLYLTRSEWYRSAREQLASKGVAHIGGFTLRGGGTASWSTGIGN